MAAWLMYVISPSLRILSYYSQVLQAEWTIGRDITENPYHTTVIRVGLRNIGQCFPQLHDELVHAFDDVLALQDNGM
jgi:hypothetical protein